MKVWLQLLNVIVPFLLKDVINYYNGKAPDFLKLSLDSPVSTIATVGVALIFACNSFSVSLLLLWKLDWSHTLSQFILRYDSSLLLSRKIGLLFAKSLCSWRKSRRLFLSYMKFYMPNFLNEGKAEERPKCEDLWISCRGRMAHISIPAYNFTVHFWLAVTLWK